MPFFAPALTAVLALFAALAQAAGPTGMVNDTGQTSCYDAANVAVACSSSGAGFDGDAIPRQDARFGRDVARAAGILPAKTGGGAAGFDFTKVCMSGELAGQGACPANPVLGTNPNEWACTKDNVTNLIWSNATISGTDWTDANTTHPLVANTAGRCGFSDGWRAPTRRELVSIVLNSTGNPAIDTDYFPGTVNDWYWSSEVMLTLQTSGWVVSFADGSANFTPKTDPLHVRLVRSGP